MTVVALVVVTLVAPSFALPVARASALADSGSQKVAIFEDVTVASGEVRDNLVVVGGDVVIHGTVENVVVVVGGDLRVAADGEVGAGWDQGSGDAAIVSVFGDVVIDPGAVVVGRVVDVGGGGSGVVDAIVVEPVMRPWNDWRSVVSWIGSTIFILLVAALVGAVAPRQTVFVSERARRHLLSSLGWGALGLIVIVPLVTVLLLVSLVGILALVPWWLAVAVAMLFGYVGVGTLIGRLVLGRSDHRGRVVVAAMFGVAVLSVIRWIPIAGTVVMGLALLVGLGATITSVWEWRRRSRAGQSTTFPPPAGQQPTGGSPPPGGQPPTTAPPVL